MSMSLTIAQPTRTEFGSSKYTHEFNPRISLAKSRFSPKPRIDSPSLVSSLRVSVTSTDNHHDNNQHHHSNNVNKNRNDDNENNKNKMATHPHRGLPPPSAMTLPDPRRDGPSLSQPFGMMPSPPSRWQGQEESMRNWLVAKAEEDKRKQEEERTRQETLKLEQRKIEQSMLRESLQGGVPPYMVPLIYAGIGGANLANVSLEWLHQYTGQLQAAQQQQIQQHQSSADVRKDHGQLIGPSLGAYPIAQSTQQQILPSQPTEPPHPPPLGALQTTFPNGPPAPLRQPPTSTPRSATHTQLPKLTTNEMYVHNPPQQVAGISHPLQHSQSAQQQDAPSSSPSIYFHHWVPPNESKGGNQPQTPASKGDPHSAHPSSSLRDSDYKVSPRKRKAQGGHEPNPPPSSGGPAYTSPPFSTTSSTSGRKSGHMRTRSNTSAGRDPDSRPESRGPPSSLKQPDSGTTNVSTGSTTTDSSSQRPHSRPQEESERSITEALPRELRVEPARPTSS